MTFICDSLSLIKDYFIRTFTSKRPLNRRCLAFINIQKGRVCTAQMRLLWCAESWDSPAGATSLHDSALKGGGGRHLDSGGPKGGASRWALTVIVP